MLLKILSKLFKRYGRHRIKQIIRGYRFLKKNNQLDLIADVNRALTTQNLGIKGKYFSKYLFGSGIEQAEIICRQYLLARVAGRQLNSGLLYSLGKPGAPVVYYLPSEWREIVKNKGFKVGFVLTALLWNAFVVMMLANGVVTIIKIVISGIIAVLKQSTQQLGSYVYFNGLGPLNLPQTCRDGRSYDIFTWYMQWTDRISNIDTICHGVIGADSKSANGIPVVPVPSPIPPLAHIGSIARFVLWSISATLISTGDLLRGRWWHALLLSQAALAAQVRMQAPEGLAKEYLFHQSGWIYRPLWTYEAENHGKRVAFYFYATNIEAFKGENGYPPPSYGYQAMNWPHYLVWDEYQADFIKRVAEEKAKISIVGPIWFQDSFIELPQLPDRSVAVFDVQPHRNFVYKILIPSQEYYIPSIANQFLMDIHIVLRECKMVMVHKRKRNIGKRIHPEYENLLKSLAEEDDIFHVEPDISAIRVIESCFAVISMPFTATALLGRKLGKPSCYYDPSGLVYKDDRAAHGIKIISGTKDLKSWVKSIQKNNESSIKET